MSGMSDSTMGIGLNGGSVKKSLFTLLTELADILFAEEDKSSHFFRMTIPEMICGSE